MKRAVVLTGLLTGISMVAFAAPAVCPTCADTEKTERGVDIVVANTAPVAEPDWEALLQSRVREADRLGLLRKAQPNHAAWCCWMKRPCAPWPNRSKPFLRGLCADTCFLTPMTKSSLPLFGFSPKLERRFALWRRPETFRKPRADWESDFTPTRAAR